MKIDNMKTFLKVLASILAGILAFLGAICIIPLVVIYVLIALPVIAVSSIWEPDSYEEEN